jgi:tetratricopeptide (TPR) repeat protein
MNSKQLLAKLNDSPSLSDEEAASLQQQFLKEHGLAEGEVSEKVNAAARLLVAGKHREAIVAYTAIMEEHPDETGTCESQIGAAYYFLGEYETAISHYETAKENDADEEMMDDNIEEAREAIEKKARGDDPAEESAGGTSPVTILVLVVILIGALYVLLK